jgi:hypothetical protein
MFFLNHQYFVDQRTFLSFEEIVSRHGLRYFSSHVKIIIFFSHRWLDPRVADNGDCFLECKNHVDQIITGFEDQKDDLKYFGFFFDYSCIPQCGSQSLFTDNVVLAKLKRLLLIELYQTLTQSTTLHLCYANSAGYHTRMWIVIELLIGLDRGIEQIPTRFRGDADLLRLALAIRSASGGTDLSRFVRDITDGLETTLPEDRIATQLTLYRYLKTRNAKIPIELMNLAMCDIHRALRAALEGDFERLERHVDNGLAAMRFGHWISEEGCLTTGFSGRSAARPAAEPER